MEVIVPIIGYLSATLPDRVSVSFPAIVVSIVAAVLLWKFVPALFFEYRYVSKEHNPAFPLSASVLGPKIPRMVGDVPPVLPNGWYRVCLSREILPGQVRPFTLCQRNLAVFRTPDGTVASLDAYCPHLGAHLAVLGTVTSEGTLRCPFHGWELDTTGKCVRIPYMSSPSPSSSSPSSITSEVECKPPQNARVNAWPTCERNGLVHVWFDAEGRPPYWTVPYRPELHPAEALAETISLQQRNETCSPSDAVSNSGNGNGNGKNDTSGTRGDTQMHAQRRFKFHGKLEHYVRAHIQELPENGPDVAHLNVLHTDFLVRILSKLGFDHVWAAHWAPSQQTGLEHVSDITLTQSMRFLGRKLPMSSITATIQQVGPSLVYLRLNAWFGSFLIIQSVSPFEPLLQHVVHTLFAQSYVPRAVAKFIMWGLKVQFERDHPIWSAKTYVRTPMLVRGDGPILIFRKWYARFYSKSSPTIQEEAAKLLSW
eukprot:ANDGO_06195.mRNA.1 Cholesterol 7-desaturase